ncbi:MAG TPA: phosphodiester glycosidase family protein [Firmicutes bacterium]|nr:phosphodiester glycosidase family protein [Bacillota bacterium]
MLSSIYNRVRITYGTLLLALSLCFTVIGVQSTAISAQATSPTQLAAQQFIYGTPIAYPAFTVETELTITADLDTLDGMWLNALKQAADDAPVLALTWSPTDSWFGPFWGIQLVSAKPLFPASLQTRQSAGFLQGTEYISLSSHQPVVGHTYSCRLGYTPAAGLVSVQITDVTQNQVLVRQSLQVLPFIGELSPYMGITGQDASAAPAGELNLVQVLDYNLPQDIYWWVTQQSSPLSSYNPIETVDRRLPTQIRITLPWETLPGALEFTLEQDDAVTSVLSIKQAQSGDYAADFSNVTPGIYKLVGRYHEDGRTWILSEQDLTVGRLEYEILAVEVDRYGPDGPTISGSLRVASDGPLPDIAFNIAYSMVKHTFRPNNGPGTGTILSEEVIESADIFSQPPTYSGSSPQVISFTAPIGQTCENDSVWQITVSPYSIPDAYYAEGFTKSVWVGRTIEPQAWTGYLTDEKQTKISVAPGIDAYHVSGSIAAGPLHIFILEVDLNTPGITIDGLAGRHYTQNSPPTLWPRSQISRLVADTGAVAGVNASFFDINSTQLPRGMLVSSYNLLRTPDDPSRGILGISADNKAYIGNWLFKGYVRNLKGGAQLTLNAINSSGFAVNSTNLYRHPYLMSPGNQGATTNTQVVELVLHDLETATPGVIRARVAQIRVNKPGIKITEDIMVLSSRDVSAALLLEHYQEGDLIEINYELNGGLSRPWLPTESELQGAASGGVVLLMNGLYGEHYVHTDTARHPRTAAAIDAERKKLYLFVIDGRTQTSVGVTYKEMADYFLYMGAFEALNLDGGGSSTLSIRMPTTGQVQHLNYPSSGGTERYVADGIGVFYTPPSN